MKIPKTMFIFLILSLAIAGLPGLKAQDKSVEAENIDIQPEQELSMEARQAKKQCEEAVKRIMATEPTKWYGDLGRDFVVINANAAAAYSIFGILKGKEYVKLFSKNSTSMHADHLIKKMSHMSYYCAFLVPVFRVLFDKFVRETGNIDKDLDFLLSQKDLNPQGLIAADFNMHDLKEKVLTLSTKCEWFRWIVRIVEIIVLLGTVNKGSPSDNAAFKASSFAVLIGLCFYVYVMQSATWKKSDRIKKLKILKSLLAENKNKKKITKTANGFDDDAFETE